MNKVILSALLLAVSTLVYAQNKTLGVGTNTPNPNAALHVESPTGNQGAIMPRLSTAQRTAMSSILGVADAGLLLYDNDLKALYIWNGTAWQSSAKLQFPLVDTLTTLPPNGNALRIVYNSTATGNFGVAHFENINPNSGFSALFARTNSATNGAADLVVNNPANTNDALGVSTNALNGRAGAFTLNNAGSRNFALYAQSNGDSTGAAVHGNNVGNGFGVFGKSNGSKFASAAVYGEHIGTGDAAGAFRISNAGNTYSALYGETNGTGPAIFGNQLGITGRAGQFQIGNATNPSTALRGFTSGLGNAAFFTINNVASDTAAVYVTTNGAGHGVHAIHSSGATVADFANAAVYGESQGTAANGGSFRITNPANVRAAVYAETDGTGPGVYSRNNGTAGNAASFLISNASNSSNALYSRTDGTGTAIGALTTGAGAAGLFEISNGSNTQAAFTAQTNGTGAALVASQINGGYAIEIPFGGIKNSFVTESTPGVITAKAGVINIDVDGIYTLSTAGRSNGETIHITSSVVGQLVRVELGNGYVIDLADDGQATTCVFVNGVWKASGAVQP